MTEAPRGISRVLLQATAAEWLTTLSLVFGGCCSNAWALQLATAQNPHAGTLITFAQFLLVTFYGVYKHVCILSLREAVCRRVAGDVLKIHARRPHGRPVYMAVEGTSQEATRFAESVVDDLRRVAPGIRVVLLGGEQNARGLFESKDGALQSSPGVEAPGDSVVIVAGEHLSASDLRDRWDYTVCLVKYPRRDVPSGSSLTVDITSNAKPVVLGPTGYVLPRMLSRVCLAPRAIPISRWAVQVVLFLLTSLMNNAAFAYDVPMAVHIIFRSGGLVINMLIGYLVGGRRYTAAQVGSVVLVTLGVACTTLSAARPAAVTQTTTAAGSYFVGILLLTLALVLSGFMGLAQDRAYEQYGRGHWQEAMFYLHFLALPGFAFVWHDLAAQVRVVHASTQVSVKIGPSVMLAIPSFYVPLLLNIVTQLVCITGVHRLTSRVNSLTVTLVLVVRKAVSLGISVLLLRDGRSGGEWLWGGAALVLVGTVGYTMGGRPSVPRKGNDTKKDQ